MREEVGSLRVSDAGEFGIIAGLRRMLEGEGEDLVCGIGDDAAVFRSRAGGLWAFTVDALVEGVHFDPAYTPWHSLGYKSLAVNVSDLASMGGGAPCFALVTLGLTEDADTEDIAEMYRGMRDCGGECGCRVVGGDIVRSPGQMFVSVSLVGAIPGDRFLTRSGARPGQLVLVTGSLGDSHLGLKRLMGGGDADEACARRHLYPRARLREGRKALELGASAAIDVSDGLLRDLGHICEESGCGADVILEKIPISREAREAAARLGEEPTAAALHGGEDYELILTASPQAARDIADALEAVPIGEVTSGDGVRVLDARGREVDAARRGYEHFKEG